MSEGYKPRSFSQTNGSMSSTQMRSNTLPTNNNNNINNTNTTTTTSTIKATTNNNNGTNNNIDKQFADLNINKKPTAVTTTTSSKTSNNSSSSSNNKMVEYAFMLTLPNGTTVPRTLVYTNSDKIIGNGSFGVVFMAKFKETGEMVAIKKVLQDKRFKNRELQIMKAIKHMNIVEMKHCFYTTAPLNSVNTTNTGNAVANNPALTTLTLPVVNNSIDPNDPNCEVFLNLVLEYVPDTVYRFCTQFTKHKEFMPLIYVKLFIFQLCKSLAYLHSMRICHRDIKPQNLLIDPSNGVLKLCDFGSAKQLIKNEPNVSYICSRYYRAPELIFGATNYTTSIDVWSVGCVMGECLIGQPLFPGESSVDQLVEIIRVLGTPTREEVEAMNKNYTEFKFPQVKPHPWSKVFQDRKPPVTPEAIDLLQQFLQYNPNKRVSPMDALAHPFFDELRDPQARLPNGKNIPSNLFEFSQYEWRTLVNPENRVKIMPK